MRVLFLIIFLGSILAGQEPATGVEPDDTDDRGPRILLVRPVITRGDDGENPAVVRTHEKQVGSVYQQAHVTIVWLPPVFLDSTVARDGSIGPDQVVELGRKRGILARGFPRLDLVFVNAIHGKRGPRGLGLTPGRICFVALPPTETAPDMEAFCVIHEMGHCFGLIHAVDDPEVSDEIPTIMGEGSFSDRIGKSALQPTHIKTIRTSLLLLKSNK